MPKKKIVSLNVQCWYMRKLVSNSEQKEPEIRIKSKGYWEQRNIIFKIFGQQKI